MLQNRTALLTRVSCVSEKSTDIADWLWFEIKLNAEDSGYKFSNLTVRRPGNSWANLRVISYLATTMIISPDNHTIGRSEQESITCAQCHKRNTDFQRREDRAKLDQALDYLTVETSFVHLARDFGSPNPHCIKSRFQVALMTISIHSFRI